MQLIFSVALLFLLVACTAPGELISAELAEPARGYAYGYLV